MQERTVLRIRMFAIDVVRNLLRVVPSRSRTGATGSAATTVTRMGGDAGLPGRAAPSRGQLCRAIGRDPTAWEGAAMRHSMPPYLVSFTPNFYRPLSCATDRQLCVKGLCALSTGTRPAMSSLA